MTSSCRTSARSRSSTRGASARSRSGQNEENQSRTMSDSAEQNEHEDENEDKPKGKEKQQQKDEEKDEHMADRQKGSTRLPKLPVFLRQPSRYDGREDITVADVHDIRYVPHCTARDTMQSVLIRTEEKVLTSNLMGSQRRDQSELQDERQSRGEAALPAHKAGLLPHGARQTRRGSNFRSSCCFAFAFNGLSV